MHLINNMRVSLSLFIYINYIVLEYVLGSILCIVSKYKNNNNNTHIIQYMYIIEIYIYVGFNLTYFSLSLSLSLSLFLHCTYCICICIYVCVYSILCIVLYICAYGTVYISSNAFQKCMYMFIYAFTYDLQYIKTGIKYYYYYFGFQIVIKNK